MDRTEPGHEDEGESVMRAWRTVGPLMDLVTPMALRVAAVLRLADLIAGGSGRTGELAGRSTTDPDALGRMLRHLVCHGVFTEPEPERFALDETAQLLRSGHPARCGSGSTSTASAARWIWRSPDCCTRPNGGVPRLREPRRAGRSGRVRP